MNKPIHSMADVRILLRRFGIVIYTGDQEGDELLIKEELKELYEMKMIDDDEFRQAMIVLYRRGAFKN